MRRVWFALLLATLPAVMFLAQDGYFASSDGMIHLYRLFELDRALHAGIFYPRWFPLSGYGYGLPVLNYYPPLSYYLAELFHLAGAGYIASIKLLIAFGFVAAAFSMFLFARDLLGDLPAFVAGVGYAYLPYLLSDAYVRGNFPEFLAMSILPLALWAFRKAEGGRMKDEDELPSPLFHPSSLILHPSAILAALAFAAIILLHHLTAMLFAALLVAYVLFLFAINRDWARLLASLAAFLLALALSAFYWLPAIAELNLVYVGPASVARFVVNRLVGIADFFTPSLAYIYLPQSEALKHSAGFPQTLLALLAGVALLIVSLRAVFPGTARQGRCAKQSPRASAEIASSHRSTRFARSGSLLAMTCLFFFLVVAASIFMTLSFSAPLWYAIPVLRFLQFPWRFQILAGIGIAFLLGALVKWLIDALGRFNASAAVTALASVVLIALGIANLPARAFPLTDAQVNLLRSGDADYVVEQMGWGWTREFVPATVQELDSIYAPIVKSNVFAPSISDSLLSFETRDDGLFARTFRVSASDPFELSLHTFFFPGWQAYIDGAAARPYARGTLGLATVAVPAGNHLVAFRFEDTPLRAAMNIVSLSALAGVAAWLLFARRRAFVAIAVALIAVSMLTMWHTRGAEVTQPIAIHATLDRQVRLVGYTAERAGDTLYVTLQWLALSEMDRDYVSFVHLLSANGNALAQQDGPPDQGLTPTTRWLPGEIVVDRHALPVGSVEPGDYRLVAGMYLLLENGYADLGEPVELGRIQILK